MWTRLGMSAVKFMALAVLVGGGPGALVGALPFAAEETCPRLQCLYGYCQPGGGVTFCWHVGSEGCILQVC